MIGAVVRFIVSAVVLLVVSWISPGFTISGGFIGALLAAIVIALVGWAIEKLLGEKVNSQRRGLVGFVTAVVVIYLAQFIIPDYLTVSLLGAVIAAFIIGIIDAFVPTVVR